MFLLTGGSFAEAFYGLRRVPIVKTDHPGDNPLPLKNEKLSLIYLVVFNYWRSKLEQLMEKWRLEEADGITPQGQVSYCSHHMLNRRMNWSNLVDSVHVLCKIV